MDDLENLNYRELRNIAKDLGIKARGKADKLIREIRKIQGNNISPNHTQKFKPVFHTVTTNDISVSEITDGSSDNEILFVRNPDRQTTTDIGDSFENLTKHNKSTELRDVQEELDKLNAEHNRTVDFEHLEEAVEDETDNEEQNNASVLDTTYEVLPDVVDGPEDKTTDENENDSAVDNNDGVNELLDVMKPEMTKEEMKAELMAAIGRKVKNKRTTTIMTPSIAKEFDDRVNALVSTKKESNIGKVSEGSKKWEKIHHKMFEKYDSIDVYLEKKNKRHQKLTTPVQITKRLAKNKNTSEKKLSKIPKLSSVVAFIPKVTSIKDVYMQFANSSSKQSKSVKKGQETSTKPLSTKKIPCATKKSDTRAPFMSPTLTEKIPFTPFNFTANKNTQSSANKNMQSSVSKKCKFDLLASLSKPITWKKHEGKLRPIAFGDVEPQYFKKGLQTSIEENRKSRRHDIKKGRTSRRENLLNTRRNIH